MYELRRSPVEVLVRELADDMTAMEVAVAPAPLLTETHDLCVEQLTRDVEMLVEELLARGEHGGEIVTEAQLVGIGAEHPRAPEVGFPLAEQRSEVAVDDVVVGHGAVGRILLIRLERVRTRADDALVPMAHDAEAIGRELLHGMARFAVEHAGLQDRALRDRVEQRGGVGLRGEQPRRSFGFDHVTV